ncbi:response regulator [Bacillus sp. A134]|uniref:response regulator n=1 Tax=Oceanobacillus sp. FSL K6-3682 TaxID=2921503 RepID=UPI000B265EAD
MFSILIVDDEWTIREGLKRTVPWSDWGIEVVGTATNGNEALQILADTPQINILLTDIRMPGINGLELIETCRTRFPSLKMVLLTGHDEFEYAQKAIKFGADDFLLKPTNIDELKTTILSIRNKLQSKQQEKDELVSLLIKDLVEHNSLENLDKIRAIEIIHPGYGFIIIRSMDKNKRVLNIENVYLIEDKTDQQVYFCHSLKNEEGWKNIIDQVNNYLADTKALYTLHLSLITSELTQLINIYKQACTASEFYNKSENLTIYKYFDEQYTLDFEEIIRYIQHHYQETKSQSELAKQLNISNSYFSKLFKQHTGMNFIDYITTKRIEVAKELLCSTTLKTYEIAHEVGYIEARYFSQIFKKLTNRTPLEYRRMKQQIPPLD